MNINAPVICLIRDEVPDVDNDRLTVGIDNYQCYECHRVKIGYNTITRVYNHTKI